MSVSRRAVLGGVLGLALAGTAGELTLKLRERAARPADAPDDSPAAQQPVGDAAPATGDRRYERLTGPDRTVVRDAAGAVLATLTDGARTAVLTGKSRTFADPDTSATVATDAWVRLLPQPWQAGAEQAEWFKGWFQKSLGSAEDDVLAFATQYLAGAPDQKNPKGVRFRGNASFGPLNPNGSPGNDYRLEETDFLDYLGMPWPFADKVTKQPDKARYGGVDCSGYVRLVYGYRAGYPLLSKDVAGPGLPRTANGLARLGPGVPVLALTTKPGSEETVHPASLAALMPGDLLFFEIDARTGVRLDHTGIFLGLDSEGHPRFISSREEADGPTFGDKGGTSRIDGGGFYGKGLRSAKRL
ncbi:hypothetical protein [Kitasatospora camelliae]|uniref:NlpC/P60 domain-containing protein n=1 Tax=Kitasatospora camelliae TaxID=3156397 RepID=A0AAU8JXC1_9ACTN